METVLQFLNLQTVSTLEEYGKTSKLRLEHFISVGVLSSNLTQLVPSGYKFGKIHAS